MELHRSPDFEALHTLGLVVRLAIHLRGAPPIPYEVVKMIAMHYLNFATATEVRQAVNVLAEAEFVFVDKTGNTINTVVANVPYYDDLYKSLGEVSASNTMSEPEQLALHLVSRLAKAPMFSDHAFAIGAEAKLVRRVLDLGEVGGFMIHRRARGKNILLSPSSYGEENAAYADLVASSGATRVGKVLQLLQQNQGWPISHLEKTKQLGGVALDSDDLAIIRTLAGDGFLAPPAITTEHAGTNHFVFGPRPGKHRVPMNKRVVYEKAITLLSAVRQGQLLSAKYAIRQPLALLRALRGRGSVGASSENNEQYRQVAQMRVVRLIAEPSGRSRVELIKELPENIEAVDMAIEMISGSEPSAKANEEVTLALHLGGAHIESLIARKQLVKAEPIPMSDEQRHDLDAFMLRGLK